jgi:hypothetical protein
LATRFRGSVLGAIVVCAVSAFVPGTALAGTLDQQQTDISTGGYGIFRTESLAQTFRAGLSGGLDQIDLYLSTTGSPSSPLNVEIRDVSGGKPSMVLATHVVPTSHIPAAGGWVSIVLDTPVPVTAGTQYAIDAYSPTPLADGTYRWPGAPGEDPDRVSFYSVTRPPSATWSQLPDGIFAFKTYVTPVTPVTPVAPALPVAPVVDKTPPETAIGTKKINGTTAKFIFTSTEPGSSFQCKLDKRALSTCSSPKKYKHLASGKHQFKVGAVDAAGNVDPTPATTRFKI